MEQEFKEKLEKKIKELELKSNVLLFTPTKTESETWGADTYTCDHLCAPSIADIKKEQAVIDQEREAINRDAELLKKVLSGEVSYLNNRAISGTERESRELQDEISKLTEKRDSLNALLIRQKRIDILVS